MARLEVEGVDDNPRTIENVTVEAIGHDRLTIAIAQPDGGYFDLRLEQREATQLLVHVAEAMKMRMDDPYENEFHGWVTQEPSLTS